MIDLELLAGGRALVWRAPAAVRVASTSVLGGGVGERRWWLNTTVDENAAPVDLAALAGSLGLPGTGVGMMTAKDVREFVTASDDGVDVVATVGLGWPTWAAAADEVTPAVGTINLLVVVPVAMSDAALVNAVATAAEAKAQALLEVGVAGTGTASDAVCIAAATGGPAEPYGGPRSTWGARVARAVHAAVRTGATA